MSISILTIFLLFYHTLQDPLAYVKDFTKDSLEVKNFIYSEDNRVYVHAKNLQNQEEHMRVYNQAFDNYQLFDATKINLNQVTPLYVMHSIKSSKTYLITIEKNRSVNE